MNANWNAVSVVDPLRPAFEATKRILFQPFDPSKWLVIGFCAWLAYLGSGGGGGGGGFRWQEPRRMGRALEEARQYVLANLHWIVPLAVFLMVLGLAVWVLFTWLSSRGQFMFLHCIASNQAEVRNPWYLYAAHGNSLFVFRLLVGLVALVTTLPLLAGIGLVVYRLVVGGTPPGVPLVALIAGILVLLVLALCFAVIQKLTLDFVVPIMLLRATKCLNAWRELLALMSAYAGPFLLYLLLQIPLHLAIGVATLAVVLATCCVAGCLLAIPYLGTVLFLPVLVFLRVYSALVLAQFGTEYDVFRRVPTV